MSTRVLTCPWCHATNLQGKLAARRGRCRTCGHDVQAGLQYLRDRRKARRQAKTQAARAALRRDERQRPEYITAQRLKRLHRQQQAAQRAHAAAWQRLRLAVDEHDEQAVATAAQALRRASRHLAQVDRALVRVRAQTPPEATPVRVVILPDKEDA